MQISTGAPSRSAIWQINIVVSIIDSLRVRLEIKEVWRKGRKVIKMSDLFNILNVPLHLNFKATIKKLLFLSSHRYELYIFD